MRLIGLKLFLLAIAFRHQNKGYSGTPPKFKAKAPPKYPVASATGKQGEIRRDC